MKSTIQTLALILCLLPVHLVSAQIKKTGIILGANIHYARPSSTFSNTHNYGLGAEVLAGVGIGKTYITATAGIATSQAQQKDAGNITYQPYKLGVRQYLVGRNVFVNADLGIATVKQQGDKHSRFTRGIGLGARILGFEAGVYYDGWKTKNSPGFSNMVMIKVGSSINL